MKGPRVGVLALQGDTREHLAALREAGAEATTVRRHTELDAVDALVIPGGESTTMSHLLGEFELLEPLRQRVADGMAVYGSCAGMILLATEIIDRVGRLERLRKVRPMAKLLRDRWSDRLRR